MEQFIEILQIVAKTGWIFANCDNDYAECEREYIEVFISQLLSSQEVLNSVESERELDLIRKELNNLINTDHSSERVFADTKSFLSKLSLEESVTIRDMLRNFIKSLIEKDGVVTDSEMRLFGIWEKSVNN